MSSLTFPQRARPAWAGGWGVAQCSEGELPQPPKCPSHTESAMGTWLSGNQADWAWPLKVPGPARITVLMSLHHSVKHDLVFRKAHCLLSAHTRRGWRWARDLPFLSSWSVAYGTQGGGNLESLLPPSSEIPALWRGSLEWTHAGSGS